MRQGCSRARAQSNGCSRASQQNTLELAFVSDFAKFGFGPVGLADHLTDLSEIGTEVASLTRSHKMQAGRC